MKFLDGLTNVVNQLINRRNAQQTNRVTRTRVEDVELRAMLVSGLGSKIIRLKTGYALNDTLSFTDDQDKLLYQQYLQRHVRKAAKYMLAFGRGAIVVLEKGADHTKPLTKTLQPGTRLAVLSGDIIKGVNVDINLLSDRYMKPSVYMARGVSFHHSRVIDFTYVEPAEDDAPLYDYGGVSEFELIYNQFINDGVVERASGAIVEKNATVFHKIKGFKESLEAGQDKELIEYYGKLADLRSIYGDGIIDSEDDVISVAQALTNLADVDQITLRRLAMVTGIPLAVLVGENVKGLNSSGEEERKTFQDTIENLQFDYLLEPIQHLCSLFAIEGVEFAENQGGTALERLQYETTAIDNAEKLWSMGEDYRAYLRENEVLKADAFKEFFPDAE
jgi:hypothetical protein